MAWNLTSIPNGLFVLDAAYLAHQKVESAQVFGVTPATLAGLVGQIDEPVGGYVTHAVSDGSRPTLNGSAGKSWWTHATSKRFRIVGSKGLRCAWYQPTITILAHVMLTDATNGGNQFLIDGTNSTNGSTGLSLLVNSSGQLSIILGQGTGTSLWTGASFVSTATLVDGQYHRICVVLNYAANTASYQLDSGSVQTKTTAFTGAGNNADASFDFDIGARQSDGSSAWAGNIRHVAMYSGVVSAGDLALWRAYDPDSTSTPIAAAAAGTSDLDPQSVLFLRNDINLTKTANITQDTKGGTAVSATDDPIGYVVNDKPVPVASVSWNRDVTQATVAKKPKYRLSQFGSLPCAYFDGTSANPSAANYTGERNLVIGDIPTYGDKSIIVVYKQLDSTQGSHLLGAANTSRYAVQAGSAFTGSSVTSCVVLHDTNAAAKQSPLNVHPEGLSVWGMRQSGLSGYVYVNALRSSLFTNMGLFDPVNIGRGVHGDEGGSWDFYGNILRVLIFNADLGESLFRRILNKMATQYSISSAHVSLGRTQKPTLDVSASMGLGI